MTLRRLEILQWTGLLAGGAAWAFAHVFGYGMTLAQCSAGSAHWGISNDVWEGTLLSTSAVLVLLAGAASVTVLLRTHDTSYEDEPPLSRIRFLAIAAVVANVIFLGIVLLDLAGNLSSVVCRQG